MGSKVVLDKTGILKDVLKHLDDYKVLIGIPEDYDLNIRNDSNLNNSDIGYIHEYGSPATNLPARPFLEPGVEDAEGENIRILNKQLKGILDLTGRKDNEIYNMFSDMGDNTVNEVQNRILDHGMVKTGQLLNSITYIIED